LAATLIDIKRRIGTTGQIRRVTATLQKVASAKLTRDLQRIANANIYFEKICEMLRLAHNALPPNAPVHPLMTPQHGNKTCLIILGSDRGLCGAFNTELMEHTRRFIQANPNDDIQLLFRGKVVYRRALRLKMKNVESIENIDDVADRMQQDFLDRKVSRTFIIYWDYITGLNQQVATEQILPTPFTAKNLPFTDKNKTEKKQNLYDCGMIEPDPPALISALLPEYIRCCIHNGFYNSLVSENTQRRASMSRATENAGEMMVDLKKTYSRLRQENITTEMLEIISGLDR
jgi:F-type H+-transporting ATPase subunit gamma